MQKHLSLLIIAGLLTAAYTASAAAITNGLVGHWTFDETSWHDRQRYIRRRPQRHGEQLAGGQPPMGRLARSVAHSGSAVRTTGRTSSPSQISPSRPQLSRCPPGCWLIRVTAHGPKA